MNRLFRFITLAVLVYCVMGCGGGDDFCPNPSSDSKYEFVMTEWRFVNDQPVKKELVGELPTLETGVQFALQLRKIGTSELLQVTDKEVRFFKNKGDNTPFEEFKGIIHWDDGTVGTFFRIDQQFPNDFFEVRGVFKDCTIVKKFRVLCPNANPGS